MVSDVWHPYDQSFVPFVFLLPLDVDHTLKSAAIKNGVFPLVSSVSCLSRAANSWAVKLGGHLRWKYKFHSPLKWSVTTCWKRIISNAKRIKHYKPTFIGNKFKNIHGQNPTLRMTQPWADSCFANKAICSSVVVFLIVKIWAFHKRRFDMGKCMSTCNGSLWS